MLKEVEDKLQQGTVAIQDAEKKVLGTGFFIGNDGSLLTCFHVVGNKETGELIHKHYQVYFLKTNYQAECIFTPPDPKRLDIAILRLSDGKLPDGAVLLPFGKWEEKSEADHKFRTFGFRPAGPVMGLYSDGIIKGEVKAAERKTSLLQLSPEAVGQEELRPGMSGAPVFYRVTERIVGIITTRYLEREKGYETIPFAIPIDAIARVWQPLANRFNEQKLHDQLQHILSPAGWFTGRAFKNLCQDLPGFFGVDYDTLGDEKPQALLEHLKKKRQLYIFINWLQRKYRNILEKEKLVLSTPYYGFVNRDKERENIVKGSPYIVLDAPVGYGKTALLRNGEIQYLQMGWLPVYVKVPEEPFTCVGVATSIQEFIGSIGITSVLNPSEMGDKLAEKLLEVKRQLEVPRIHRPQDREGSGIVLLIDNIERIPDEEVDSLINQFIPCIQEKLKDSVSFRVCFAGRYIGQRLKQQASEFQIAVISLTPFEFDIVRETIVRTAGIPYQDAQLRAAHLMYTTGGHPGCMARILHEMNFMCPPDFYFQKHRKEHKEIVLSTAHMAREDIPDHFRNIFDVLSFFRRFNHRLLDQIVNVGLIDWPQGDAVSLSNRLTETYLVKREGGFLHDEIARRLLSIRMRWERPEEFIKLFEAAQQVYEQDLQEKIPDPDAIALEGLFTKLHLKYYSYDDKSQELKEPDQSGRKTLADQFFTPDGILNHYLGVLVKKPYSSDIFENLKTSMESDWEFRFTLNYFLRQDQYNSVPYQKTLAQIDEFFSKHSHKMGGENG